jgi:hypothetical protein
VRVAAQLGYAFACHFPFGATPLTEETAASSTAQQGQRAEPLLAWYWVSIASTGVGQATALHVVISSVGIGFSILFIVAWRLGFELASWCHIRYI